MRDHIGEGYKAIEHKEKVAFDFGGLGFHRRSVFPHSFDLKFYRSRLKTFILWRFWIQAHVIFQQEHTFRFQS